MSEVRISVGQMNVCLGQPEANWETVQRMTPQAKQQGADLVVFPELWDAGLPLKQVNQFATPITEGLFNQVTALASEHEMYITGSMLEKRSGQVYNCAPVISPTQGILAAYRKIHLFPLMQEDKYLAGGNEMLMLDMPWGPTGIAICYDLRFPEIFRHYAVQGAKMVILPSEWPHPRLEHFRTLVRARAIENGMFIVAVNRVGVDVDEESGKATKFFGHSTIVDPWGNIVFEAGEGEGVFTATIDLSMSDEVRRKIPVLESRRPELYEL